VSVSAGRENGCDGRARVASVARPLGRAAPLSLLGHDRFELDDLRVRDLGGDEAVGSGPVPGLGVAGRRRVGGGSAETAGRPDEDDERDGDSSRGHDGAL